MDRFDDDLMKLLINYGPLYQISLKDVKELAAQVCELHKQHVSVVELNALARANERKPDHD